MTLPKNETGIVTLAQTWHAMVWIYQHRLAVIAATIHNKSQFAPERAVTHERYSVFRIFLLT